MKTKKLLAMLLAIAMITAIVPGLALTAGAADPITAEVISGNKPVLPGNITWEKADYTNEGTEPITVPVNGTTADGKAVTAQVKVYPMTFTMPSQISYDGQPGNVVYLPGSVSLKSEFRMEFDLTINAIKDASVQIGADGKIFSAGQIGLGTNGNFSPTGGDGKGNNSNLPSITTVAAGETYRIFMTANASVDEYNLTLTKADGSTYESGVRHFRTNSDYINTITMLTNSGGADGDLKIRNVKFYAPEVADNVFQRYTVKIKGVSAEEAEEYIVTTTSSMDKGYNDTKVFPDLDMPYFPGYVFKGKSVNTSNQTITLTYDGIEEDNFFDNVDSDTPFISLNMLGAHDAFTSEITYNKKDAAGVQQGDSGSRAAMSPDIFGAGALAVNKSIAQSGDALVLLDSGVRYFDIRLSRSNKTASYLGTAPHTNSVIYTTHGLLSNEFGPILQTIAQWAKEHPGEIIVLDFQEYYDNVNSDGNSNADSWRALDRLLTASGIKDFVTLDNGSDIAAQTYGGLTSNGTKANIVLFGRAVATNNGVGKFILRGDTSGLFNGKLYSNYSTGVKIGSSYSTNYVSGQVTQLETKTGGNHAIASMFRVMQAQSGSDNLITQATKDHDALYNDLIGGSYPNWLTALPVVMVDDAAVNTNKILDILKECNEAQDTTFNYTGEATFSAEKKTLVGTLYTGNHELVPGGDYGYYVTTKTPNTAGSDVIKVPYNGSIDLDIAKLSNIYTMQKDERSSINYTKAYFEDDKLDTNFSAYNWGAEGAASDNRRVGVAILETEKGHNSYTLDATQLRNYAEATRNTDFYAISYEEYKAIDISDFDAVKAYLTDAYKVGSMNKTYVSDEVEKKDYTEPTEVSIRLDATKMNTAIGESGKVVIFGDSHGGLYRLSNDIKITATTVPVANVTPALGWDGNNFTVDFLFGEGVTGKYTIEVFNGTASIGSKEVTIDETNMGLAVVPAHTNAIYTARVTDSDGYVNLNTSDPASVYSLVAAALETFQYAIKTEQKQATLDVLKNGGFYLVKDEDGKWDLNAEARKIMDFSAGTITLKDNVIAADLTFGDGMKAENSDGKIFNVTVNGTTATIDDWNDTSITATVIYLEDVEFVFENIAENAADEAVSGELSFVEEV